MIPSRLPPRQLQVLAELCRPAAAARPGDVFVVPAPAATITARLGLSEAMARNHLRLLLAKFGLPSGGWTYSPAVAAELANKGLAVPAVRALLGMDVAEANGDGPGAVSGYEPMPTPSGRRRNDYSHDPYSGCGR